MDFLELVKEMKPTLRDTSVHSYAVSLKSIAPPEANDLEFLKDTSVVLTRLEKYKPNTRKNYLNAAIVVLKGSKGETFDKAIHLYETKRDKLERLFASDAEEVPTDENLSEFERFLENRRKGGTDADFYASREAKKDDPEDDWLSEIKYKPPK